MRTIVRTLMMAMMMFIRMMITCPPSTVATGKGTESADLPPDVRMFNENIRGVVKNGLFTVWLTVRLHAYDQKYGNTTEGGLSSG